MGIIAHHMSSLLKGHVTKSKSTPTITKPPMRKEEHKREISLKFYDVNRLWFFFINN